MYHLGWFLGNGFGIQAWNPLVDGPWTGTNVHDWSKPDLYVDLTSALERAGFDYLLIEDTAMIEDTYKGSAETALRRGFFAPKNDPMPLVPLLTQQTRHIGIVPTVSTIQYPPYLAARLMTTLDHLTEGRVGMNIVTSVSDRVAQNFGFDRHLEHDERYVMASEWTDVVRGLQNSWEDGAVVADVERGIYADHTKVHRLDHAGQYFKCRGPLNTLPGPQKTVPIASAGNSPAGRDFAARYADTMLCGAMSIEEMKSFRKDMHRRLRSYGRNPDAFKLLFIAMPIIAATDTEAQDLASSATGWSQGGTEAALEFTLWWMTYASGGRIDFGSFDLDKPVSDLMVVGANGEQESLARVLRDRGEATLREIASKGLPAPNLGLIGSPETVAAKMDEIMQEVGGDGFLLSGSTTRSDIAKVCDGLAPVLRRRGSIRKGFDCPTFYENLVAF